MIRQGNTTQGRAVLESLAMKIKEKKKEKTLVIMRHSPLELGGDNLTST